MKTVLIAALALACALSPSLAWPPQDPAGGGAEPAADRLGAAKACWARLLELQQVGAAAPDLETSYRWSHRWLEAALAADPALSARAHAQHLQRMTALSERIRAQADAGRASPLDVAMARYFVADARHRAARAGGSGR